MVEDLIKRLKEAAQAATPQNLDTAQTVERYEDGSHITCPTCDGEGYAELNSDFCNYDGKAIGVQFYGIGPEHLAAEAYFRAASPAAILELIAMIEQQAARIAELEAAIRKQANAARSLADATIRDASIRQGLAEKAYAESSPEVLASERQANAMLTEENERLTGRLTALESERDALLAAAGKEAVAIASDAWEAYLAEQKMVAGMPGLHARPSFIAGFHAAMSAVSTTQATAIYQTRGKLDPDSEWTDHRKKDFDILRDDLFDKRIVYTAPTAALENGDGRDAWQPQWIVNDLGELGVKVGSRFFFLYKGDNIEYGADCDRDGVALHDDGTQMKYRTVGKREFGEVCWPLSWIRANRCEDRYTENPVFTPGLSFGKLGDGDWKPLPAALSQAGEQQ